MQKSVPSFFLQTTLLWILLILFLGLAWPSPSVVSLLFLRGSSTILPPSIAAAAWHILASGFLEFTRRGSATKRHFFNESYLKLWVLTSCLGIGRLLTLEGVKYSVMRKGSACRKVSRLPKSRIHFLFNCRRSLYCVCTYSIQYLFLNVNVDNISLDMWSKR